MMARRNRSGRLVGSLEAMLYAFFFVVALAIAGVLFGVSLQASHEAARLEHAVELANDAAARFAADPAVKQELVIEDGLRVVCPIEDESKAFGHLYHATIRVFDGDEVVYKLETSRYVSARGGAQ